MAGMKYRLGALAAITISLALAGCSDLGIKTEVENRISEYQASLVYLVMDGSTVLNAGDTVAFSSTMLGTSTTKTFTIQNNKATSLNLVGPTYVAITGGAGSTAYTVTQPSVLTIPSGGSTTFSITVTPTAADSDYPCSFVVNTDDTATPSFAFNASAHSTQWHGIKSIAASSYDAVIGINGDVLYVLYFDSVVPRSCKLVKSANGGATWGTPFTVDNTNTWYDRGKSIAVDGSDIYVTYWRDDDVFFRKITDNGTSFTASTPTNLSNMYSSYPYGYDNAVTYDSTYVYVAYSAGSAPVFTYAPKTTLSFSTPVCIDNALTSSSGGNSKRLSMNMDTSGHICVCYVDDVNYTPHRVKYALFDYNSSFPLTVNPIAYGSGPSYINSDVPSGISLYASSNRFVAWYDNALKNFNCYYAFSYGYMMMIMYVFNSKVIDSSSADIGDNCRISYNASNAHVYMAYHDNTNNLVRFSIGVKNMNGSSPSDPPDYYFTPSTIASAAGGMNFDISLANNGSTIYTVYYDSTGSGSLMFAKSLDEGTTW